MTIRETAERYGTSKLTTSYGDNLWKLCFRIYGDDSLFHRRMLTELNYRYDWENIEPGSELIYINANNAAYASEID